ncbi:MAG TPA: polyhydroxyalkanoate synthesis regulator DNA-binding domain-containing protein [Terracidiphilus sp.]
MKKNVAPTLIIKKYENRRLYNTLTSQYINQEQVAQLVRDGYDVRVVDAATREDITRLILAQIVLEDAKTPDSIFPLDVLRQMILASGRATQENALRYMKAMLDMYQNAYRALPPLNPFEFMQAHWLQPAAVVGKAQAVNTAAGSSKQPENRHSVPEAATEAGKVDELKRRIEELESLLSKRAAKRNKQKQKSRRKA